MGAIERGLLFPRRNLAHDEQPPLGSFRSFASIALQVFLRRAGGEHLLSRQTREDWEWFATPDGDKKSTPAKTWES